MRVFTASKAFGASKWSTVPRRHFVALAQTSQAMPVISGVYNIPSQDSKTELMLKNDNFYTPSQFNFIQKKSQFETQNRYRFDVSKDKIGHGFFAQVYKAQDLKIQETVAVKVIDKNKCPTQVFEQELKVMTQIKSAFRIGNRSSDGLALHKDIMQNEDKLSFVFEYFNGGDAFDEIVDNGPLSEDEAKVLMKRIVPALLELHESGFIHRDVKLENLLLRKNDDRAERLKSATLADFGYAKKVTEEDGFENPAGTFGYVAPEILSTRRYSPACDVWSLGALLFTSVAGYQPFPHVTNEPGRASTSDAIIRELEAIQTGTSPGEWQKEMQSKAFKDLSDEFKNLLRNMLNPCDRSRIRTGEILNHVWLQDSDEDSEISEPVYAMVN